MAVSGHSCGPEADQRLFEELSKAFLKFPDLLGKYQIRCVDHETDIMGIDFEQQVAVKRIEGGSVIAEFRTRLPVENGDNGDNGEGAGSVCCDWQPVGDGGYRCSGWWVN